jgi:hypothetical protein
MRFVLILFLIFTPYVYAQRNLGRESFMQNVRPVLNGILGDYYQMIALFPDYPKGLNSLIQELDTLTTDKEILKESCPRTINKNCKTTLNSIREKLSKIQSISLQVLTQDKMSQSLNINSLSGLRIVSQFDSELAEIKGYLDNASFLMSAQLPQKRETYFILKELDELTTLISLAVVEYIPYNYQNDFRHFFFNFVFPIQVQISKNKNYEFLNRNVNSLNFAINLLNMNLTKRNKKTPEGMAPFLSVIHNRWNSLLRYYF